MGFRSYLVLSASVCLPIALVAQNPQAQSGEQGTEIKGVVLMNAYYSDDLVDDRYVPLLAAQRNPISGDRLEAVGSSLNQSIINVRAWSHGAMGADINGELELDFFGEMDSNGRRATTPRLRRAVATVRWEHAWLLVGRESMLISPLNPSSFSTVAVPGFTASGNLSRWMPQVRFGWETGGNVRIGIEAAAVSPRFYDELDQSDTQPDEAEQSNRPFVQGRLLSRWGTGQLEAEVGVGGHYGWYVTGVDSLGITKAATVSAKVFLTSILEFRGEGYYGEALGMLGRGAVGQTLSPRGDPQKSMGGWAQINLRPNPLLELGGGYGVDDPDDAFVDPAAGIRMNVNWELHCNLRVRPLLLAVEYRRLETTYADQVYDLQTANYVNVALGFVF